MDRGHGKERQKGTGPQHAEHVSKVGAGSHADVLDDVSEDLSSLDDAAFEHHQILLQQNQIGRFFCDVGRSIHRNANVRGTQCGSIVDAIAQESHNVTFAAQDTNDSLLVRGREAGEECCLLCRLGQFGVGHFLDFIA